MRCARRGRGSSPGGLTGAVVEDDGAGLGGADGRPSTAAQASRPRRPRGRHRRPRRHRRREPGGYDDTALRRAALGRPAAHAWCSAVDGPVVSHPLGEQRRHRRRRAVRGWRTAAAPYRRGPTGPSPDLVAGARHWVTHGVLRRYAATGAEETTTPAPAGGRVTGPAGGLATDPQRRATPVPTRRTARPGRPTSRPERGRGTLRRDGLCRRDTPTMGVDDLRTQVDDDRRDVDADRAEASEPAPQSDEASGGEIDPADRCRRP